MCSPITSARFAKMAIVYTDTLNLTSSMSAYRDVWLTIQVAGKAPQAVAYI